MSDHIETIREAHRATWQPAFRVLPHTHPDDCAVCAALDALTSQLAEAERERDEALSQLVDVQAQQAADVAGWRRAEATNTRLREALQAIAAHVEMEEHGDVSCAQFMCALAESALAQDTEQETA